MWTQKDLIKDEPLNWGSVEAAPETSDDVVPVPETRQGRAPRRSMTVRTQRPEPVQKDSTLAETLLLQVPAMALLMQAMGLGARPAEARPLHEIESYGPVGFDFVDPEMTASGPFVVSDDVLDAVHAGQIDIDTAMSVYWQDVPRTLAFEDPAWIEEALVDLPFDQIDTIDLSFGVEEQPPEYFYEDDLQIVPIIDDFMI